MFDGKLGAIDEVTSVHSVGAKITPGGARRGKEGGELRTGEVRAFHLSAKLVGTRHSLGHEHWTRSHAPGADHVQYTVGFGIPTLQQEDDHLTNQLRPTSRWRPRAHRSVTHHWASVCSSQAWKSFSASPVTQPSARHPHPSTRRTPPAPLARCCPAANPLLAPHSEHSEHSERRWAFDARRFDLCKE